MKFTKFVFTVLICTTLCSSVVYAQGHPTGRAVARGLEVSPNSQLDEIMTGGLQGVQSGLQGFLDLCNAVNSLLPDTPPPVNIESPLACDDILTPAECGEAFCGPGEFCLPSESGDGSYDGCTSAFHKYLVDL